MQAVRGGAYALGFALIGCGVSEPDPGDNIVANAAVVEGPSGGSCHKLLPFEPSHFTRCDLGPVHAGIYLEPTRGYWMYTDDSGPTPRGELWRRAYENVYFDEQQQEWVVEQFPDTRIATLPGVVIDQPAGPEIYVVTTTALHVGFAAILNISGSRPLAWVSTGDMLLEGAIAVSTGANDPVTCASAAGSSGSVGTDPTTGLRAGSGGGGAASAFGSGGDGGAGQGGVTTPGGSLSSAVGLVGGCPGGHGGGRVIRDDGSTSDSSGGRGGGAIQLVAGRTLRVAEPRLDWELGIEAGGMISGVSGSLGRRGSGAISAEPLTDPQVEYPRGGGGGGSGGLLLVEAVDIVHDGWMDAHGGDGGTGGNYTYPIEAPAGGAGGADNPDGGDGSPGGAASTTGASGGGGASGRIVLRATNAATIGPQAINSPTPIVQ